MKAPFPNFQPGMTVIVSKTTRDFRVTLCHRVTHIDLPATDDVIEIWHTREGGHVALHRQEPGVVMLTVSPLEYLVGLGFNTFMITDP
jgi:hypothetical protein